MNTRRLALLAAIFVVAACGLVYELVAGAVASYLLGDAVTQYSLVIGTFLCAMGIGSWLARFVQDRLLRRFVQVELLLALIGGLSSLTTFAIGAWLSPWFGPLFYAQVVVIGVLVGVEIPLLVRLLEPQEGLSSALSDALALDYLGALVGALAFPLLALPMVGLTRSSVVFGVLNLAVAVGLFSLMARKERPVGAAAFVALALGGALIGSGRYVRFTEDLLYQDRIVQLRQSSYQRIVLTRWRDDLRLYLDGHLQFSSVDEARYHEALVVPALAATRPAQVLILGGGDGLAVRRVLQHPDVTGVDVVDLDPEVTALARTWQPLVDLNGGALDDPRVTVHHQDALRFLEATRESWDVILIDLPDPHSATLAKLYSTAFYALASRRLRDSGVLATQATSPFYAPEAYWSVVATLEAAVDPEHPGGPLRAWPYHLHVPSFGQWGFVLASRRALDPARLSPSIPTEVLDGPSLAAMFVWDKALGDRPEVQVNRLDDPVLATYYRRGWRAWND